MRILVVGGGGREHAVVKALRKSPRAGKIFCAPGNGGISSDAECVSIDALDIEGMVGFAKSKRIDLVCVTPDDPLCAGMTDAMNTEGIRAFGPVKKAAMMEGSKVFSKGLMKKYGIPTGGYEVFDNHEAAYGYIKKHELPVVIKADGLALGKGVLICDSTKDALQGVDEIMVKGKFGKSGSKVVIEDFLKGPEVTVLSFCDGDTLKTMPAAQDHKKAFDGDKGLNTGGMGAFSPVQAYTPEIEGFCKEKIFKPTIDAMKSEGIIFKGILYFGLILTEDGPKVLEYNARFGDPEAQVILPLLKTDLLTVFDACIDGKLDSTEIGWSEDSVVCVVLASGGYPGEYKKGFEIKGLDSIAENDDALIYHAGTRTENGRYYTNGGRVIGVTAKAPTLNAARERAYNMAGRIMFEGMFYRKDIGIK